MSLLLPLLPLIAQVGPFATTPGAGRSTPVEQGVTRPKRRQTWVVEGAAPEAAKASSTKGKDCVAQVDEDAEAAAEMAEDWLASGAKGAGERAEANLCLGLANSRTGDWDGAEKAFLAGRDAAGADRMLRARLGAMAGNAALAGGANDRALAALDGAKADVTGLADPALATTVALDRARALVALKRPAEAEAALAEARAASPNNPEGWLLSATLSRRQGKLAEAQAQIERAAELMPIDPAIGLEAGVIAMLAGHEEAARKSWQSVVTAAPDSPEGETAKGYLAQLGPAPTTKRPMMVPLSVLDLCPVREGGSVAEAMAEAPRLAKSAEDAGYARYWVAEHHGMAGIAGGATSVVLAHVGNATSTIRLGAGGIMLPNHNPFVIAEQFGALDAMFAGRIDLGLGRAPGADQRVAQMLHKDIAQASQYFPQDVVELAALFDGDPRLPLQATPGAGAAVEMWVLGSSLFGASLAAQLGLPYAFASHFAPDHLDGALKLYRERFQPSARLAKPHVMVGMTVLCAETDEEAQYLASSQDQSFVALRTGTPGRLKPPVEGYRASLPPQWLSGLEHMRQAAAVGSRETVRSAIAAFVERTQADEVIVAGSTYDPAARRRSLALTMEAMA